MNQDIRFCTSADGVRLAYAVSGEGPPLVMSATWLTHLEHQWRSLAWQPWLEAFARDHRLLRYDSRGCGLSDRDVSDLSFEHWIQDFECVVEAASLQRFALLATCQGGPIAIEYAARNPERVSHLILYGTYARGRLRWSHRPKEVEKGRLLLDLTQLGWGQENHALLQVWASAFQPGGTLEHMRSCGREGSRPQNQMSGSRRASGAGFGGSDRRRPPACEPYSGLPFRSTRQRKSHAASGRARMATIARGAA